MTQSNFSTAVHAALEASCRAADLVMRYYQHGAAVERKADATPVTIADREAEALICELLGRAFPEYGFLGEESGTSHADASFVWVVDPIDGTKNFIRRIPLFGILIGLLHDGMCDLGVSNVPGMQELLWGEVGEGACLNGARVNVSDIPLLRESTVSIAGMKQFYGRKQGAALEQLIRTAGRLRAFGDVWPYHLVASGRIEAVVEIGIKVWDIAALAAIIEAAGGRCTDIHGESISVKTTSIIASNGKVHDELLNLFR